MSRFHTKKTTKNIMLYSAVILGSLGLSAMTTNQANASTTWKANTPEQVNIIKGQKYYEIKWGDTLWAIGIKSNLTVDKLMALNTQIQDRNLIYAGDTLTLSGNTVTVTDKMGNVVAKDTVSAGDKIIAGKNVGTNVAQDYANGTINDDQVQGHHVDNHSNQTDSNGGVNQNGNGAASNNGGHNNVGSNENQSNNNQTELNNGDNSSSVTEPTTPTNPETKKSSVTIQLQDDQGNIIKQNIIDDITVGTTYTAKAPKLEGYVLKDDATKSVNVAVALTHNMIIFTYSKDNTITPPAVDKADVTVKAVDENGKVLKSLNFKDQKIGSHFTANSYEVAVDGYDLNDDQNKSITVSKLGNEITFKFKKHVVIPPVDPTEDTSSVEIDLKDTKGNIIRTDWADNIKIGSTYTATAPTLNGYKVIGDSTKSVEVSKALTHNYIEFTYEKDNSVTPPVDSKATVTIKALDENGQVIKTATMANQKVGSNVTVNANQVSIAGYDLNDSQSKTVQVSKDGSTVTFNFKKHETVTPPVAEKANVTIKAVDETGQVIKTVVMNDKTVGAQVTVNANQVSVAGYDLNDATTKTVQVAKGGSTIIFNFKKHVVTPPVVEKSDVTINALDENGKIINSTTASQQEVGKAFTANANQVSVAGYDLNDQASKTIIVSKTGNVINFTFKKHEVSAGKVTVTVHYVWNGVILGTDYIQANKGEQVTATAKHFDGYTHVNYESDTQTTTAEFGKEINFSYTKDQAVTDYGFITCPPQYANQLGNSGHLWSEESANDGRLISWVLQNWFAIGSNFEQFTNYSVIPVTTGPNQTGDLIGYTVDFHN